MLRQVGKVALVTTLLMMKMMMERGNTDVDAPSRLHLMGNSSRDIDLTHVHWLSEIGEHR